MCGLPTVVLNPQRTPDSLRGAGDLGLRSIKASDRIVTGGTPWSVCLAGLRIPIDNGAISVPGLKRCRPRPAAARVT
jgi:hypothetical protein